jgi:multiple antibiotic resistance protein
MLRDCLLAFVALFVAVDILGVIPLYLNLSARLPPDERRQLPRQSVVTATLVGLGFLLVGDAVLRVLGITASDFQIAGGILLVILSLHDLLSPPGKAGTRPIGRIGAVPLGTPLIVGPAALATLALLLHNHGLPVVLIAFGANMLVAYGVLRSAGTLGRAFGQAGAEVFAKVANLLLAAFGVSLVRRGVMDLLRR